MAKVSIHSGSSGENSETENMEDVEEAAETAAEPRAPPEPMPTDTHPPADSLSRSEWASEGDQEEIVDEVDQEEIVDGADQEEIVDEADQEDESGSGALAGGSALAALVLIFWFLRRERARESQQREPVPGV